MREQLIAESGARHELVHCTLDCLASFVGYPPRGAARYTLALRARAAPSVIYVLAEHIARNADEYGVTCRQLPGLDADIVLLRGDQRALDALRALAMLERTRQPCRCVNCTFQAHSVSTADELQRSAPAA